MALRLQYMADTNVPVEVEGVTPDKISGLSALEIAHTTVFHGNEKVPLGDLFQVSGDASDLQMIWEGNLAGVHWLGAKMNAGTVKVHGSAGRHLGSQMQGGTIDVSGDAGDWVGAEMRGGRIRVKGNAGHLIAAAYRGSARGMTGGSVIIDGDVGNEVGHTMRRGLLAVGGSAGDLIGFNMLAGTILVFGTTGIRHGAGMRRGTIFLGGSPGHEPLPTFRAACVAQFEFLKILERSLRDRGFECPVPLGSTTMTLFNGDLLEGGRGELLVPSEVCA